MRDTENIVSTEPAAIDRGLFAYRVANVSLFLLLALLLTMLKLAHVTDDSRLRLSLFGSRIPELCVYKRTQGVECPSCGLTRSVVLLLDGEFQRSQSFDARGVEIAVFLLLQVVLRGLLGFPRPARYWKWDVAITAAAIVACFARFIVELPMQL